jgi:hypothetical protein
MDADLGAVDDPASSRPAEPAAILTEARSSAGWTNSAAELAWRHGTGDAGVTASERTPDAQRRSAAAAGARDLRTPILWGVVWGCLQAASPLAFFWLDDATVYALGLVLIAAVYIGFSVADGRGKIIAVETCVATVFVVVAAVGVTGSAWLLVVGLAGHGLKDLWQYRTGFVANTRWWPPFCAAVDVVAAGLIAVGIVADVHLGW